MLVDNQQLETIGSYVKDHLPEWLEEAWTSPGGKQLELAERIVRVEEALERQGEGISRNVEAVRELIIEIGHSREGMQRNGEAIQQNREDIKLNRELIKQNGEAIKLNREDIKQNREAIKELIAEVRRNSEAIKMQGQMLNQRIEDLIRYTEKRFSLLQWLMLFGFTIIGTLVTIYRFVGTTP